MKKVAIPAAVLFAVSLWGSVALASSAPPDKDKACTFIQELQEGLGTVGLSDAQKTAIEAIFTVELPKLDALRDQLKADRAVLEAAFDAGDNCIIGAAYRKVRADEKAVDGESDNIEDQVRAVLTHDQNQMLSGFFEAQRDHRTCENK
jgi:hypothetical protein